MMSDPICPNCGHSNAEQVEICQTCGAFLKKNSTEPLPPIHPGEFPEKRKTSDLESTLPGWLRDARKASDGSGSAGKVGIPAVNSSVPQGTPKPGDPTPFHGSDLLAGLSNLEDDEEQMPAWLKNIQNSLVTSNQPEQPTETQPEPHFTADLPADVIGEQEKVDIPEDFTGNTVETSSSSMDWLDALSPRDETPGGIISPVPQMPQATSSNPPDPAIYADLPDWLAALTGGSAGQQVSAPIEAAAPKVLPADQNESSDWFSGLGGDFMSDESAPLDEQSPPTTSAESSDWMDRMGADAAPEAADVQPEAAPASAEMPDWLASLQTNAQAPLAPAGGSTASVPSSTASADLPDWLAGLNVDRQAKPDAVVLPTDSIVISNEAGTLPDWLAGLQETAPVSSEPGELPAVEAPSSSSSGLTDWLSGLQASTAASAEPTVPALTPQGTFTLNDLHAVNGTENFAPADIQTPGTMPDVAGAMVESAQPGSDRALPDWLSSLGSVPPKDEPVPGEAFNSSSLLSQTNSNAPIIAAETEQSVAENQDTTSFDVDTISTVGEAQNIDDIFSMDDPEWLSGAAPVEVKQANARADDQEGDIVANDDLSPEVLPSWVQAMRPMESFLSQSADGDSLNVENQGPLAGLRSVLPGQPVKAEVYTTKAYSTKLLITETQHAQTALLENLLNSENTPRSVSKRSGKQINRSLRWLIAAVLLLVVFVAAAVKLNIFPAPGTPGETSSVGMFHSTVAGLPDGAPVLVVLDYQPGFAGELETAAAPMLEHLMQKNARLAFVSSSPTGSLMAERLIQKFSGTHAYRVGTQYVVLGYIPGGAAGIKAFADQPGSTLGHDALSGNLWDLPVFQGVSINSQIRLSNFAALIVATDNPDTGRLWIEQARPTLSPSPMLLLVSTQAEPMLRPYWLSKQINGIVAGVEGGMLYENALGFSGQAHTYWNTYGAGMLVAELFILVGGIWGLISGLLTRRASIEQDEA